MIYLRRIVVMTRKGRIRNREIKEEVALEKKNTSRSDWGKGTEVVWTFISDGRGKEVQKGNGNESRRKVEKSKITNSVRKSVRRGRPIEREIIDGVENNVFGKSWHMQ